MQTSISTPDVTHIFSSAESALDHAIVLMEDLIATGRPATTRQTAVLMRDLPYCVQPVPGHTATDILVNRHYKPLGCPARDKFARYENFVHQHFQAGGDEIDRLDGGSGRHHYLYSEGRDAPWSCSTNARLYAGRLETLRTMLMTP
jgi:hypothetical protein